MEADGQDTPHGPAGPEDGADEMGAPHVIPGQGGPPERETGGTDAASPGLPRQRARSRHAAPRSSPPAPDESGEEDAAGVPPSDAGLLARMRAPDGDGDAFDELYRRHAAAVRRYARTCCRDADTAEDLTNEVFARTLQAVRGGKGPRSSVRAYLLTSVRHVAAAWARTQRREQLVDDFAVFAQSAAMSVTDEDTLDLGADVRAMRQAEQSLVVQAFRSLSEKDQALLWHTTVEEAKPRDVAPLMGLSDNATAVAAHRARENLKKAYLQAHVSRSLTVGGDCARYADRLGAYARGGLRMRAQLGMRRHLEQCSRCREAAAELANLNEGIRTLVPVALIGWFATAGGAKAFGGLLTGAGATVAGGAAAASGAAGGAGSTGGAASESVGMPVKVGIAAGVATAAGVAVAFALAGSDQSPKQPQAHLPASPSHPVRTSAPEPSPRPTHTQEPPRAAPEPPAPKPSPKKPTPTPSHTPTPTHTQEPPPSPTPSASEPPKPPPPADYQLNQLKWDALAFDDDHDEPRYRTAGSSWLWQRWGMDIDGHHYDRGVTMHPSTSVTIDLNRRCESYDAFAGVDDLTRSNGAVTFAVYGDGARLWQSRAVRGGQEAVPVHVQLAGVGTVRLVVQPHTPLGAAALADWAEARIRCR